MSKNLKCCVDNLTGSSTLFLIFALFASLLYNRKKKKEKNRNLFYFERLTCILKKKKRNGEQTHTFCVFKYCICEEISNLYVWVPINWTTRVMKSFISSFCFYKSFLFFFFFCFKIVVLISISISKVNKSNAF